MCWHYRKCPSVASPHYSEGVGSSNPVKPRPGRTALPVSLSVAAPATLWLHLPSLVLTSSLFLPQDKKKKNLDPPVLWSFVLFIQLQLCIFFPLCLQWKVFFVTRSLTNAASDSHLKAECQSGVAISSSCLLLKKANPTRLLCKFFIQRIKHIMPFFPPVF